MNLETPWALSGLTPALPVHPSGPVDARAALPIRPVGRVIRLSTPWAAADVRLPVRATTHPGLPSAGIVPVPRGTAEGSPVLDRNAG